MKRGCLLVFSLVFNNSSSDFYYEERVEEEREWWKSSRWRFPYKFRDKYIHRRFTVSLSKFQVKISYLIKRQILLCLLVEHIKILKGVNINGKKYNFMSLHFRQIYTIQLISNVQMYHDFCPHPRCFIHLLSVSSRG